MADTGADNWEQRTYLPIYDDVSWYADGTSIPCQMISILLGILLIKLLNLLIRNESDKPFFAYIPFQAVHIPVQAPKEFSDKYAGVYDRRLDCDEREKRRQRIAALFQKELKN